MGAAVLDRAGAAHTTVFPCSRTERNMTIGAPDLPLAAGFDPPTHEAWLALVDKVLKGADREKRLVT